PPLQNRTGHFHGIRLLNLPIPWHGQFPKLRSASATSVHSSDSRLIPPARNLRRLRAFPLFLAPRSFRRPSPCQPIRGVTLGLCFEGVSHPGSHAVGTSSRRVAAGVTSFLTFVVRRRSATRSPGFLGGEPGSHMKMPSP